MTPINLKNFFDGGRRCLIDQQLRLSFAGKAPTTGTRCAGLTLADDFARV